MMKRYLIKLILSHLLNDNDIEINADSYDFTKDINLYTQTYIGSSKYTNNVLSIYRFLKQKILFF